MAWGDAQKLRPCGGVPAPHGDMEHAGCERDSAGSVSLSGPVVRGRGGSHLWDSASARGPQAGALPRATAPPPLSPNGRVSCLYACGPRGKPSGGQGATPGPSRGQRVKGVLGPSLLSCGQSPLPASAASPATPGLGVPRFNLPKENAGCPVKFDFQRDM